MKKTDKDYAYSIVDSRYRDEDYDSYHVETVMLGIQKGKELSQVEIEELKSEIRRLEDTIDSLRDEVFYYNSCRRDS